MKTRKTIYTLCLLSIFISMPVKAERDISSGKNPDNVDHYGIVDAVYSDKSCLIITDRLFCYTHESGFYNKSGQRIFSIGNTLKPGTPVIFHSYQKATKLMIKNLKIISMREFKKSKKLFRDRN
ncbi:MAG: hypothetical protein QM500_14955 [Methylococcales bacterium]